MRGVKKMSDFQMRFGAVLKKMLKNVLIYSVICIIMVVLVFWTDDMGYGKEVGAFLNFLDPVIDFLGPVLKMISYIK